MYICLVYKQLEDEIPKELWAFTQPEKVERFQGALKYFRNLTRTYLDTVTDGMPHATMDPLPRLMITIGREVYRDPKLWAVGLEEQLEYNMEYLLSEVANHTEKDSIKWSVSYQQLFHFFTSLSRRISSPRTHTQQLTPRR